MVRVPGTKPAMHRCFAKVCIHDATSCTDGCTTGSKTVCMYSTCLIHKWCLHFSTRCTSACTQHTHTHTHTHTFNGPLSRTTRVSRYQKSKTNLDFAEARDSEWQWHQLGRMQICTSLQTDSNASTPPLSFFTGWMPFLPPI